MPLDDDALELLAMSVDFESDDRVNYCLPDFPLRCYGGSVQELMSRGCARGRPRRPGCGVLSPLRPRLERIMVHPMPGIPGALHVTHALQANHRADIADIAEAHAERVRWRAAFPGRGGAAADGHADCRDQPKVWTRGR